MIIIPTQPRPLVIPIATRPRPVVMPTTLRVGTQPVDIVTGPQLENHIQNTTPHPAYDDLPSLTSLFRNGLV